MTREQGEALEPDVSAAQSCLGMSRRSLCVGVGGAVALLALGGVRYLGQQPAVRPPGGQDEDRLFGACNRCGKCFEVCPRRIIKPQHLEDGILGARTPYLDFSENWCDWCAEEHGGVPQCVEVCPTTALALPSGATPETIILGKAVLKTDWCLAYKKLTECRWCLNACPYEAIELDGNNRPYVLTDRCNGCGACESACISLTNGSLSGDMDTKAIVVVAPEEVQ